MDEQVFIGGYGSGVRALEDDPATGAWRLGEPIPQTECASWGVFDTHRGLQHLVIERDDGRIRTFRDDGGRWTLVADVSSGGATPCFVEMDPTASALAVANYQSGHVALIALDPANGLPVGEPVVQAHVGDGPRKDRQDGPHAHCVRFHGGRLYSVDLGADTVFLRRYRADPPGLEPPDVAFAAPPGQGPRQLLFDPARPQAFLLTELGSRLFVLSVAADGRLEARQDVSTLPPGFDGPSLGGHLALNSAGDRLYVSNRGHDSIAVFAVAADGAIEPLRTTATGGASPRHFQLLEARGQVVVTHEEGDCVTVLPLAADGTLEPPRQTLAVSKPAFVGLSGASGSGVGSIRGGVGVEPA